MIINNPFNRVGPTYGNPYFKYGYTPGFNVMDSPSPFFNMEFRPFEDTYIGQWYNMTIAPITGLLNNILSSVPVAGDGNGDAPGGSNAPGGGDAPGGADEPSDGGSPDKPNKATRPLSTKALIDKVEKVAEKNGSKIDGWVTLADIDAAIAAETDPEVKKQLEELRDHFTAIDTNNDKYIDSNSIDAYYEKNPDEVPSSDGTNESSRPKTPQELIKLVDTDGDGYISQKELDTAITNTTDPKVKAQLEEIRKYFTDYFDDDKDGYVTAKEIQAYYQKYPEKSSDASQPKRPLNATDVMTLAEDHAKTKKGYTEDDFLGTGDLTQEIIDQETDPARKKQLQELKDYFGLIDTDHNGWLTTAEIDAFYKKHPTSFQDSTETDPLSEQEVMDLVEARALQEKGFTRDGFIGKEDLQEAIAKETDPEIKAQLQKLLDNFAFIKNNAGWITISELKAYYAKKSKE